MARSGAPMTGSKRHYLVATDGSLASDKAVAYAIARAKEAGVPLLVMMGVEGDLRASQGGRSGPQLESQLHGDAKAKVDADAARAREAGVEATAAVVEIRAGDSAAETIARFALERRVSEVVVGSHGRTGLMAQMLGSVADQVVKLAHCHVTVVR
jgi:nucleotide-binding universal stress UspA family protein